MAWSQRSVPMTAYAGDWPVVTLPLELLVCATHFTRLPAQPALGALPPLPAAGQGYLIRSCPAADPPFRLRREGDWLLYVPRRYERHWVALDGSFEAYLAQLSGKTRATLKRKRRKFEAAPGSGFCRYRTPAELAEFHALARQVSALSYQERLIGAGLPDDPAFHAELQARAAAGTARGYLLVHQGAPVAYTYCPIDDGVVEYAHTGFDPAHKALSPGTVLQLLVLEDLFAEGGLRLFDFTEGDGAHKALFGTHRQTCMDLYILRWSLATWRSVIIQTVIERGAEGLAAALAALGVKRRLKAMLRGA